MPTVRDHFQVVAFKAHYKIAIRAGDNNLMAFAKAIGQTSDEVTDKILKENPSAIDQWVEMRQSTTAKAISQATDKPVNEQGSHGAKE